MKKHLHFFIFIISFFAFASTLCAAPIDSVQATTAAKHFFAPKTRTTKATGILPSVKILEVRESEKSGSPYFYIVENQDQPGWVILSGDDEITPVIACSDEDYFNGTNPTFEWWMSVMQEEIDFILEENRKNNLRRSSLAKNIEWMQLMSAPLDNVEPEIIQNQKAYSPGSDLMNGIKWNQSGDWAPNKQLNYLLDVPAGCVATAMGQIMKYWGRKNNITALAGKGSYQYTDYGIKPNGILREKIFEGTRYNLAAMPESTPDENIRSFLYDLGISVRMQYKTSGSGALSVAIPSALYSHFGFKPALYKKRSGVPAIEEWKNLIKADIDQERPVIYNGDNPQGGGHSFVISGYNSADLFYFNWGWSGSNNGWYKITLDDGSYSTAIKYSDDQDAILGLEPYAAGESLGYRIFDVEMEYRSADCGTKNQYFDNGDYAVVMKFKIENNTNSTSIPLTSRCYATLTGDRYSGSTLMSRVDYNISVPIGGIHFIELPPNNLNRDYYFNETFGIKDINCDLGFPNGDGTLDIGRNPKRIEYVATEPGCELSPFNYTSIDYCSEGKISFAWKKEAFLKQDKLGEIKLYNNVDSTPAVIGTATPADSGAVIGLFDIESSARPMTYMVKHEAEGKTPVICKLESYVRIAVPAYPQVKKINAAPSLSGINLNWELYHEDGVTNYQDGDYFEIECYDNPEFSGNALWRNKTVAYVAGQKDYSLRMNPPVSTTELYFRIRRTYTSREWGWSIFKSTYFRFSALTPDVNGILYVNGAGNNGNGSSWGSSVTELADALDVAAYNTAIKEIWVAEGTYSPKYKLVGEYTDGTELTDCEKTFLLPQGVKIYGGFAGNETLLQQRDWRANTTILTGDLMGNDNNEDASTKTDNAYRVVTANNIIFYDVETDTDQNTVLDGFTIRAGNAILEKNIRTSSGTMPGGHGGAIMCCRSKLILSNLTISDNTAIYGGGISFYRSPGIVQNSTISNNTAVQSGGGVYNYDSTPELINVLISNNKAFTAGAITNSTGSDLLLLNVTVAENESGIHNSSSLKIYNSLIWGNGNYEIDDTSNCLYKHSLVKGLTTTDASGNIDGNVNPLFKSGVYSLEAASKCRNAGSNSLYLSTLDITGFNKQLDLAGNPRLYDNTIDIGAYENQTGYSTGISSKDSAFDISIYPNPAQDFIYIQSHSDIQRILIYDGTGSLMKYVDGYSYQIELNDMAEGFYFFKIETSSGSSVYKIYKK